MTTTSNGTNTLNGQHDLNGHFGPVAPATRPGPLSGKRIIDFTWAWAGPYGAMQLALLGA